MPDPHATHARGLSTKNAGSPVAARIAASNPRNNEPPPVIAMPKSAISADNSGGVDANATLTVLIILDTVCAKADAEKTQALQKRGAEVIELKGADGRVDLQALLTELAGREVNEVHLEAGSVLTGEFVRQGLVDELLCYIAPKILGEGRSAFHLKAPESLSEVKDWAIVESSQLGNDIRMILRKRK